jgi:hypothetical protein
MTYSHEPDFRYYFVGFRCCRDAAPDESPRAADGASVGTGAGDAGPRDGGARPDDASESVWAPSPQAFPAPAVDAHDFAPDPIEPIDPTGPSKTKFTWVRKAD